MFYNDDKKIKKMTTSDMIVLCNILDEYETFHNNLVKLLEDNSNREIMFDIYQATQGKKGIGKKKITKFYEKNKDVLDKIKEISSVWNFLDDNYTSQGEFRKDSCIYTFYNYLREHEDKLEIILANLQRLERLGISTVEFDENISFDNEICSMYTNYPQNFEIVFFDNIQPVLNYEKAIIKYSGNNSHYRIVLMGSLLGAFRTYGQKMTMNSLIFPPENIPEAFTEETIYNKITSLRNTMSDSYISIRNSVDLGVSIYDLKEQLLKTTDVISNLDNIKEKEDLIEILADINDSVEHLEEISAAYDENIADNDENITKKKIDYERKRYLKRRDELSIDTC